VAKTIGAPAPAACEIRNAVAPDVEAYADREQLFRILNNLLRNAAEAGAAVTDIFGHDLDVGHGAQLEKNRGIVCAPPRVHGLMIAAIQALGIKEPE